VCASTPVKGGGVDGVILTSRRDGEEWFTRDAVMSKVKDGQSN
jgi:hypothetical protein